MEGRVSRRKYVGHGEEVEEVVRGQIVEFGQMLRKGKADFPRAYPRDGQACNFG